MTISAYEIAAVFKLTDEFSGPLKIIAERVAKLNEAIKSIANVTKETNTSVAGSLRLMGGNIGKTTGEVEALALAWGRVKTQAELAAAASKYTTPPTFRSGIGPGSHGGGRLHYRPSSVHVPGAGHIGGGTAGMIGAGAGAYSIYEAVEMADIASRGLANVYQEGLPKDFDAKRNELIAAIVKEAGITGLPLNTVAKMALDEIKTNANQPWENRMKMLPLVIESAAREAYTKNTSPEAATSAFVGQLHQIRAFTPEEIEKYAPMIAYFASKDPNSLTNIGKSGGYHTPIGTSLMGIPIEQDLAAQTVLDRTGVGGKSGTWLREMVTRAAKPIHDKNYAKKIAALQGLGLADAQGNPTWMKDGRYDEQILLHKLNESLKGIPVEERAGRLKQVFGERGSGAVALMTEDKMLNQYDEVLAGARAAQSNSEFWKQQNAANPAQAFKGAWVDLQSVLLDIGTVALPPVVTGLKALDTVLKSMTPKQQQGAVVGGVAGTIAGYMAGGPVGAVAGGVAGGALGADVGRTNKMTGGGLLGAVEDAWRLLGIALGTKAKAEESKPTFSERFGQWGMQQKTEITNHTTTVNLDGETIGRIVEQRIAQSHELPDSASSANGVAQPNLNDWNPTDGIK